MKLRHTRDFLIPSCLLLFAVSVRFLPWQHIFDAGKVYFYDPDCYIRLRKILVYLASFPATAVYDYFEGFPKGTGVISPPTGEYIIAAFLYPFRELHSLEPVLERIIALLPPFVGGITITLFYGFMKRYFGKFPAFVSSLILAISPSHIEATVLGRFDNEMIEPLLLLLAYFTYSKTYDDEGHPGNWYAISVASALFLMFWRGALFPLSIIGIDLLSRIFFARPSEEAARRLCRGAGVMYLTLAGIFALVCVSDIWGTRFLFTYNILSWFDVAVFVLSSLLFFSLGKVLPKVRSMKKPSLALFVLLVVLLVSGAILLKTGMVKGLSVFTGSDPWLSSVQEYQSLPLRWSNVGHIMELYGGLSVFAPLLLIIFRSRIFDNLKIKNFFIIWTVIMMLAVIARQRFAPYIAINVAIMASASLYYVGERVKSLSFNKVILASSAIGMMFLQLPVFPYIVGIYRHGSGFPIKGDIEEAMLWLRDKTPSAGNPYQPQVKPSYGVLARWDYGGWIESMAGRPTVATNFGTETYGMEEIAGFFLSSDESEMERILQRNEVRYILVDRLSNDLSMYAELLGRKESFFSEQWSPGLGRLTYVPTRKYYSLIVSRLFYADGSMKEVGSITFDPVERLRLVHETESPANIYGFPGELKKLKVFEYAGGVTVWIRGAPGRSVTLSQTIETNQGRQFDYHKRRIIGEDGNVGFILLYPQKTGRLSVGAIGPAVFSDGTRKVELILTDSDIEQEKVFRLSFIGQ